MTGWKKGDLVRLLVDDEGYSKTRLPEGTLGKWGWVSQMGGREPWVTVAGASRPFDADRKTLVAVDPRDLVPFVRQPEDEPAIAEAVRHVLVRTSWTLPGAVSREGVDLVVERDRNREKATFPLCSLVAAEVAPYLGPDGTPNEAGHALLDAAGIGRTVDFHVTSQAYRASFDRTGSVRITDVGLGTTHVVTGEAALDLVRIDRAQSRFSEDGSMAAALREALPLPRTMRLDTKYSKVDVKVIDVDGDAVQVHRDDEVSTYDGKDGKKVRKAALTVFDIARWTRDRMATLTPSEAASAPKP